MNKEYLDFIEECKNKNYVNVITQKHHIIPKHMGGDNCNNNLIELSLDDHYTAHILLSECYDGKYKRENLASAIMIKGYLDNSDKLLEYQTSLNGIGNPNYGNRWDVDKRNKASKRVSDYWSITDNKKKIQKPKSDSSKMGKYDKNGQNNPFYGKTHSDGTKQKLSELRKGIKPSNTLYIEIDGIIYNGLNDASTATGINPTTIWYRIKSKNIKYSGYKSHPAIKATLSN
jgi:hypothetical protein